MLIEGTTNWGKSITCLEAQRHVFKIFKLKLENYILFLYLINSNKYSTPSFTMNCKHFETYILVSVPKQSNYITKEYRWNICSSRWEWYIKKIKKCIHNSLRNGIVPYRIRWLGNRSNFDPRHKLVLGFGNINYFF